MPLETDSLFQRLGGLESPFRATGLRTGGFAALDPQRDVLLELFAAAINAELGEAWTALCEAFPLPRDKFGASPVTDKLPDEPTEQLLTQRKSKFPLLAIHRSGSGVYEPATLEVMRLRQPWSLHYILGPLDAIDARQFKDVCVAVAKIVALVIKRRGHQAYQSGALQFFGPGSPNTPAPFSSVRLVSHEGPGQAVFGGDTSTTIFWAIEMRLETTEISSDVEDANGGDLDAADITVAVGGSEGLLPAMIIAKTDQDPNG